MAADEITRSSLPLIPGYGLGELDAVWQPFQGLAFPLSSIAIDRSVQMTPQMDRDEAGR